MGKAHTTTMQTEVPVHLMVQAQQLRYLVDEHISINYNIQGHTVTV